MPHLQSDILDSQPVVQSPRAREMAEGVEVKNVTRLVEATLF